MNYAYLDKYGILHVTTTAQEGAIRTSVESANGFPKVNGQPVYMYSLDEVYIGGNRKSFEAKEAKKIDAKDIPQIEALYRKCMK